MSKVLGPIFTVAAYITGSPVDAFLAVLFNADAARRKRRDQERRARAAWNASLKDRLEMVDLLPDAARTLAMGRVRAVEGVRRRWTSGANEENLTLIVSFAGHEIDAFEQWYFNDTLLELDEDGYVLTPPYAKTRRVAARETITLNGSGAGEITLAHAPAGGAVSDLIVSGSGEYTPVLDVDGSTVTVTAGPPDGVLALLYEYDHTDTTFARIRWYLGTAVQNVGAELAAEYPGKINATDRFAGIAVAVLDLKYDPDIFPQGRPALTAVMRGAKVYDPRLDSTVAGGSGPHRVDDATTWEWSENSSLCADHYARWANGWALPASARVPADIMAAADVCDVETTFTLRKPDDSTEVVILPRYRCGIVIPSDADPRSSMDEIFETMAGRWGWAGGQWRMRAGAMKASSFDITPAWIAPTAGGNGSTGAVVKFFDGVARSARVNRVTGLCVDPAERYQALPFPAVEDPVLIAAKGEQALEVEYQGVNHPAQAQHLASIEIRRSQAGLRAELRCNPLAWKAELLDVCTLQLPRYGMTDKTMEVTGWRWHPAEGVTLQLEEITAAIFTVDDELAGRDPAPNSTLRPPWEVETLQDLEVTSGTEPLTDGSVLTRTRITWTAAVGQSIRRGGQVEIQYTPAADALPTSDWPSWTEQGTATEAVIPGLVTGIYYRFRARFVQLAPRVEGDWCAGVVHQVAAPPAASIYTVEFRDDDGVFYSNLG